MSFFKKNTEAAGSGRQERKPRTFSTGKGSGTMNNGGYKTKTVLTLNTKLHEWSKSMEARVLDAKLTRWRTLWDIEPSEPKLKKRSQYLARMEEAEDGYSDADSDDESSKEGEGAEAEGTAAEKANRLKHLNRKIDDLLLKDSVTLDDERQTVYSMIWNSIDAEMQMRCEMHRNYRETRNEWNALDLLTIIEECHSKTSMLGTEYARTDAYEQFVNIKQDYNASLVAYKADFDECVVHMKKYGDIPFTNRDIVLRFVRSLNGRHNAYAIKLTEDYHSGREIPDDIDEVVAQLMIFEAARADVYSRSKAAKDNHFEQLAIHNNQNAEVEDKRVKRVKPTDECRNCGKKGHWAFQCTAPKKEKPTTDAKRVGRICTTRDEYPCTAQDNEKIISVINWTNNRSRPLGETMPTWVCVDNCAESSIFANKDLLTGLHKGERVSINTVAGTKGLDTWGYFGPFKVLYNPTGIENLLSEDAVLAESEHVESKPGSHFTVWLKNTGERMKFLKLPKDEFGRQNKFYVFVPDVKRINGYTVRERESQYTKSEVERAKGVRDLKLRLGGASDRDMMEFIRQSVAVGCPYTPADVKRATVIYGPDIASLKGKTTDAGPVKSTIIDLELGEQVAQMLYIDVFEVEGQPFVLGVMKPLHYRFAAILDGKSLEHTYPAVKAIMDMIWSKGFTISRVEVDPEGGLAALKTLFQTDIDVVGAGTHVASAEREGRVVKERCRMILAALPYELAARFMRYLVMFVVTRLNLMPRAGDGGSLCPRERFTGKKIQFKRELEIGFGDYAEVFSKPEQTNSMEQRTISAIALCPAGNDQGAWKFYDILSCTVVVKTQWKVLPIPDMAVKIMNTLAREDAIRTIKGGPLGLMRGTPMVGEIPAGRMIVNPSLDVPRFDENGELVQLRIIPRKNKRRASKAAAEQAPVQAADPVEAPPEAAQEDASTHEDITPTTEDVVPMVDAGVDYLEDLPIKQLFSDDEDDDDVYNTEHIDKLAEELSEIRRSKRQQERRVNRMSVKEAKQKYGDAADAALQKEVQQIVDMESFKPLHFRDLTEDEKQRIIHSSAFLKEKLDDNGDFALLKARLVGSGNEMDRDLYESGSSPTVATESVFIELALMAGANMKWATIDIGSAYLHSKMEEFVAVLIAPSIVPYVVAAMPEAAEFVDSKGRLLVQLLKALYGCLQSSRLWYNHMSSVLIGGGYRVNQYDPCVFHKGDVKEQSTVCLHVDDLFVAASTQAQLDEVVELLKSEFKEVKVKTGKVNSYLGMRIKETADFIEVDMTAYIEECLTWAKVAGVAITPAEPDLFEVDESSPAVDKSRREDFHTGAAKLLYLAKRCRADILPAVSFLCSRVSKCTEQDVKKLQRVFKYLAATKEKSMRFRRNVEEIELMAYVDAGYGIHDEGQSRSGLVVTVNGTPVMCKTSKQAIVTKSSTEAELVALTDGSTEILWVREFLIDQGYDLGPTNVGEDNKSVLTLLEKRRFGTARTKHIKIRYFFVVDRIQAGELKMVYVPTDLMIADFMTKPLSGSQFKMLQEKLLGHSASSTPPSSLGCVEHSRS